MGCVFCLSTDNLNSIEHIIPESLGNKHYTLEKGIICNECNSTFAVFENTAQSKSILGYARSVLGVKTKKGKPSKGKTGHIQFIANPKLGKNFVLAGGLKREDLYDFNPNKNSYKISINPFTDSSEIAVSKLLLKMGIESLYKSKKTTYRKYNFQELIDYIKGANENDWPFVMPNRKIYEFIEIPEKNDTDHLEKLSCRLLLNEKDQNTLIFRFEYAGVNMEINLLNRNTDWMKIHLTQNTIFCIYPDQFNSKS